MRERLKFSKRCHVLACYATWAFTDVGGWLSSRVGGVLQERGRCGVFLCGV